MSVEVASQQHVRTLGYRSGAAKLPQRRHMNFLRHARCPLRPVGRAVTGLTLAMTVTMVPAAEPASADANTTVVYEEAGDAADIGLIGDSSLSGVRWYDEYGDLRQYNFVFDAESCRRTLETSCWSREQYRAETALQTMRRLPGEWGEVLVMMTGYNDPAYGFDDAVEAVIAEAQRQGIPHVMWLTLPTSEDVSYEEPLHQANAETYRESNEFLLDTAAQYDGYLEVADWATHSAGRSEWFENDGVHLTYEGATGVTTFIADQVERVLAGETVTPAAPPWETLGEGDNGSRVARVQQALLDGGFTMVGGVDGSFGAQTAEGVRAFQRQRGIAASGVVDEATAVELDVYIPATTEVAAEAVTTDAAPTTTATAPTSEAATRATSETITEETTDVSTPVVPEASAPSVGDGDGNGDRDGDIVIAVGVVGAVAVPALLIRGRARSRSPRPQSHRTSG